MGRCAERLRQFDFPLVPFRLHRGDSLDKNQKSEKEGDRRRDADGLAHRQQAPVRGDVALDLARHARRLLREPFHKRSRIRDLGSSFTQRFAALGRRDGGERLGVRYYGIVPRSKGVGARSCGRPRPALERVLRVLNGTFCFLRAAVRDVG